MIFKYIWHTNKVFSAQYHLKNTLKPSTFLSIRKFRSHSRNPTMEKIIAIGQMRSTNDKLANRQQVYRSNKCNKRICLIHSSRKSSIIGPTDCGIGRKTECMRTYSK